MIEVQIEKVGKVWQVADGGKIYVYASLEKAIKNTWWREFYGQPHLPTIKGFTLTLSNIKRG